MLLTSWMQSGKFRKNWQTCDHVTWVMWVTALAGLNVSTDGESGGLEGVACGAKKREGGRGAG